MDINATLLIQIFVFVTLVWGTMRFIWPSLMQVMEDRRDRISDGLAAAEQGKKELEQANDQSKQELEQAKAQANQIIDQANQRAVKIVEEAKQSARVEGERLIQVAHGDIAQQYNAARERLVQEVAGFAVAGAEKVLNREIKQQDDTLLNELIKEI